jgi:hypothetical protein
VRAPYVHLEVLGPRSALDRWLATLQDVGTAHLADAMRGLEGEAGVGRPVPGESERSEDERRSEPLWTLRGLERLLPRTQSAAPAALPGGSASREEALAVAARLRAALEHARDAEQRLREVDAARAGVAALAAASRPRVEGSGVALGGEERADLRVLQRRSRGPGGDAAIGRGDLEVVLLPPPGPTAPDLASLVADTVARPFAFPPDLVGLETSEAARRVEARAAEALRTDREATERLRTSLAAEGPRARRLLDHLEDAEARAGARSLLAATPHVVAARLFVRREDEDALRRRLARDHGGTVVVRSLGEADDVPGPPARGGATPLQALDGLRPDRAGEVSVASLLALWSPPVFAVLWADLLGGLVLLLLFGAVGVGARAGSARRETALLGQVTGLVSLLSGMLAGRALGAAGEAWFGSGWGLADRFRPGPTGAPFTDVLAMLGAVAFLLAAWGAVGALRLAARGRPSRGAQALLSALVALAVAGGAAAAVGSGGLRVAGTLAGAAAACGIVWVGRIAGLVPLVLDAVGVLRLVAVGGTALWVVGRAGEAVAGGGLPALAPALLALLVAPLLVVLDAALVASGSGHAALLSGRGIAPPFVPFARRGAAPAPGRDA